MPGNPWQTALSSSHEVLSSPCDGVARLAIIGVYLRIGKNRVFFMVQIIALDYLIELENVSLFVRTILAGK